jgi:hypothetical protein
MSGGECSGERDERKREREGREGRERGMKWMGRNYRSAIILRGRRRRRITTDVSVSVWSVRIPKGN